MQTIAEILSKELNETLPHVQNVIELLDGGNTVPFIARYRKEMHGSMDDQQIRRLADRLTYLRNLDARRSEIKQSIALRKSLPTSFHQSWTTPPPWRSLRTYTGPTSRSAPRGRQ